jgi:hypothetical protein
MTYPDHFWPFLIACNQSFLVISNDFSLRPTSCAHCNPQFNTVQHPHSSVHNCWDHRHVGISICEATSAYHFGPTSVWQFRDIVIVTQAHNRCYEPDMVILKVGLLRKPLVLCTSGKIYQLSAFHFKISHYIYTPLYIPEKQVELHPTSVRNTKPNLRESL